MNKTKTMPKRNPISRRRVLSLTWQYAILIFFGLILVIPIIMMVFGGLKTRGELLSSPFTLPNPPRFENYLSILSGSSFWTMMRNSLIITLGTAFGVVLIASLAAFVLARIEFKGKFLVFNYFTIGLLFPLAVAILPVYILLRQLSLLNSLIGVILPMIAFGLSGNILILRGFFISLPKDLQDAAVIDGCSTFDFYWRIMLPLSKPALSAVTVMTMVLAWNELFLPLIVLDKDTLWPLPLGTFQFMGQYGQDWALVMAFVTLTSVPAILFYMVAERQIVSGLTAGAIKG
jgi:raffinose/stachyose/melibiose transport system permease protein